MRGRVSIVTMRALRWFLFVAVLAALVLAAARLYGGTASKSLPGTALDGRPAPDFTLTDETGQARSLSSFRGKVVVLAFIDSRCVRICPLTALVLQRAQDLLGSRSDRVQFVAVNTNPLFTDVKDIQTWSSEHGMEGRWVFLTGSLDQLEPVWRAYGIASQMVDGVDVHTPAVYLLDSRGGERRLLLMDQGQAVEVQARGLAAAIQALLG